MRRHQKNALSFDTRHLPIPVCVFAYVGIPRIYDTWYIASMVPGMCDSSSNASAATAASVKEVSTAFEKFAKLHTKSNTKLVLVCKVSNVCKASNVQQVHQVTTNQARKQAAKKGTRHKKAGLFACKYYTSSIRIRAHMR